MSLYNNYIYNDLTDTFYILIYKLGSGSYSNVWYSLEFEYFHSKIKNKKKLKINPRALKIHNEDCYEQGEIEMKINEYISDNKKKSPHINYPISSFVYDDIYYIVVYEVAIGSLYDVMKIFDKKLPIEFVNLIIPQLQKPVEFIHKYKLIHTDIKPENYLLMGTDEIQQNILEYSLDYNLDEKLKKISGIKKLKNSDFENKVILDQLNNFLKKISTKFNLKNNILGNDEDSDNNSTQSIISTHSNISLSSLNSFYSIASDESKEEDYETVSSYDSRDDEYDVLIDNFHTDKLIKILFEKESKYDSEIKNKKIKNHNNIYKIDKEKKQKYLLKIFFSNPIVKLTDFGTMIRFGETTGTIQTRYYRAPEIILGNNYDEKIDLWSLGCTIYELATGNILFYTCKDDLINKYDVDLINIKMLLEKIETEQKKILLKKIYKSKRKKYFINNQNCLNFLKKIESKTWIEYINFQNDFNNKLFLTDIIILIKNLLNVNPKLRNFN